MQQREERSLWLALLNVNAILHSWSLYFSSCLGTPMEATGIEGLSQISFGKIR